MLTNNHLLFSLMSYFSRLDSMLRNQDFGDVADGNKDVVCYTKAFAEVENAVVVLSDLRNAVSLIVSGTFGLRMGLRQTDYSPLIFGFVWKSMVVNSVTGGREELTPAGDSRILSARELQVLNLIETGRTSEEIAGILAISKHTVSRHRQAIIAKL